MNKFISLLAVILLVSFSGCDKKDDNTDTGDTKNEVSKETKSDLKSQSSEIKEDDKKQEETSEDPLQTDNGKLNELGMTPGLPADYPNDIPQPKNSKVLGSLNSSEGTVVTFESSDKVQDIVDFYKVEMKNNGYVISDEGETLVSDKGGLINWTRNDKTVGLMLGYDKDKNITSLVITYN